MARHRSKQVTLWRQGEVNFILNAEPESFAQAFQKVHGPSACAMAFRVADADAALARAVALGAKPFKGRNGPGELDIPAIEGIGGSLLYLVDRYGARGTIYDQDFVWLDGADRAQEVRQLTLLESCVAREPPAILHQVVEQHRPPFRHGVVAHPPVLDRDVGAHEREVQRVPELVQQRRPVLLPAERTTAG